MTSEFGQRVHERRHDLSVQLIEKLLKVQPEDENYALALDFCLQKEYYHSFSDINPRAVEAFYVSIIKRLQEDSQLSKASVLSALTTKFLSYKLSSVSTDINHNLLQLLASLAGQPLDSVLEETPQILAAVYGPAEHAEQPAAQQHRAVVQRFKQLAAGGSRVAAGSDTDTSGCHTEAGSNYDPYGEESDLTDWESDDENVSSRQQLASPPATPPSQPAEHELHGMVATVSTDGDMPKRVETSWYLPPSALQAPQKLQPGLTVPQPRDLLLHLSVLRADQVPLMRAEPDFCFTEAYLAQQVLRLLQGHEAHGFLLRARPQQQLGIAAPGADRSVGWLQQFFEPDPRATFPGHSPGTLRNCMGEFAEVGSKAWQLRKLAQQLTQNPGSTWLTRCTAGSGDASTHAVAGGAVTPCLRALGVALQQQLDIMGQRLAHLQQAVTNQTAAADSTGTASTSMKFLWTLQLVRQQARPIMRRLQLLHSTVFGVLEQLGGSPANLSAAVLNGLYQHAAAAANLQGAAQQNSDAAALLHLFLCSCVPMVSALAQWLWSAADGGAADSFCESRQVSSQPSSKQPGQQQPGPGDVSVCCEDFFIVRKSGVAATDARFWHAAYGFSNMHQPTGMQGVSQISCPSFLAPLASSIMTAGKGVRLLDHMEQEELRTATFMAARAPAAAWAGTNMRQSDSSTTQHSGRPHSSSGRLDRFSRVGGGATRRRWAESSAAWVSSTAVASHLTRQVRLQLAMAAVAGQQEEQPLAANFIQAASTMLQHSQQCLQRDGQPGPALLSDAAASSTQHKQQQQRPRTDSAAEAMQRVLLNSSRRLAQACGGTQVWDSKLQLQQPELSFKEALMQSRADRDAHHPGLCLHQQMTQQEQPCSPSTTAKRAVQQRQVQEPAVASMQTAVQAVSAGVQESAVACQTEDAAAQEHPAEVMNQAEQAAVQSPGQHQVLAATGKAHTPLLDWRQQVETKLAAAGSCLEQLAPWHHHKQQRDKKEGQLTHTKADSSSSVGIQQFPSSFGWCSSTRVPGSFSGSLAALWPLRPSAAAPGQLGGAAGQQCCADDGFKWRAGGSWPSEQLSWLLVDAPLQVTSVDDLLNQAMLKPIQERVDLVGRQLLTSLMGEWGLLQQLQGLVGVFLLSSPAMVEWTEYCFRAVETETATKRLKLTTNSSKESGAVPSTPGGAGAGACVTTAGHVLMGPEDLDIVELEMLLQDLAVSSDADDPLPDPSCLHLTLNTAALRDVRTRSKPGADSTAVLGSVATTGGLWCCAAEWAGLSCRHSGTWQLSLVYDADELSKFSAAWRFLLQLRWVRRRLDAARHTACKASAACRRLPERDAAERAAVTKAQKAKDMADNGGFGYSDAASSTSSWMSSREEQLLLQEMGQLMARWQQYVMDRLIKGAWNNLEQRLCGASSLDDVRAAAAVFLRSVSNMTGSTAQSFAWRVIASYFNKMMDIALGAAAASARLTELRQQLAQPGKLATTAAVNKAWLDIDAARTKLRSASAAWRVECNNFVSVLKMRSTVTAAGDAEIVLEALDMNGYYQNLAKPRQSIT